MWCVFSAQYRFWLIDIYHLKTKTKTKNKIVNVFIGYYYNVLSMTDADNITDSQLNSKNKRICGVEWVNIPL